MPSFSKISSDRLATCHPDLIRLFNTIILVRDCAIVYGFRGQEEQDHYFAQGKTKLKWPNSMHNKTPSLAVDATPYPLKPGDWDSKIVWIEWSSWVQGFASGMEIAIRSGYDWDRDHRYESNEQTFWDGPHFELIQ